MAGVTAAAPVAVGTFTMLPARAQAQLSSAAAPDFRNISVQLTAPGASSSHCRMWMGWDRKIRVRNCTLRSLISEAYDVSLPQFVTGPWSTDPAFDITADVPSGVGTRVALSRLPGMMRQLLATRLGVVIRSERRQVDGYALGISSGGSKLRRNGRSVLSTSGVLGPDSIDMTDFPLSDLVSALSTYLGSPVVDQTGLQGAYEHRYQVRWVQSSPGAHVDPAVLARSLDEQLGLRIEARRVTVDTINVVSVKLP
jgi:uncharacterized protein (TIGR03435 family)